MKRQICIGLVLSATLVVLGLTPGMAQESQHNEDWAAISATTTSPASAPWFVNTVDSPNDVGQHVSVALDPNGTAYISYYDATFNNLRMAKYVGSGGNCGPDNDWSCETVDSAGDVGKYSSIAVDPTDNYPIIAYYDATNGALKLAIGSGAGWIFKTVHDPLLGTAGLYASLKLDSTGKTRISYYLSNFMGNDSLWYAKYSGGGGMGNCTDNNYQCTLVDSGDRVGKYTSLALDSADQPRIAYYDSGNDSLKYAYENSGNWTIREILPIHSGQYASLYVDINNGDRPHIAHYDATNGELGYAVYVGSNGNCGFSSQSTQFEWQCDKIESVGTGTHPMGVSLAVDGAGYPLIAYQNATEGPLGMGTLKVARPVAALNQLVGNCGPVPSLFYTWQCDTLLPLGPYYDIHYRPADYVGIDLNSAGLATIAYYGNDTDDGGVLQVTYQRLQVFLPLVLR